MTDRQNTNISMLFFFKKCVKSEWKKFSRLLAYLHKKVVIIRRKRYKFSTSTASLPWCLTCKFNDWNFPQWTFKKVLFYVLAKCQNQLFYECNVQSFENEIFSCWYDIKIWIQARKKNCWWWWCPNKHFLTDTSVE